MRVSKRVRGRWHQVQADKMETLHHTQAPVKGPQKWCLGYHPCGGFWRSYCHSSANPCHFDAEENVQELLREEGI